MVLIRTAKLVILVLWTLFMVFISLPNRRRGWKGRKATAFLVRIWAKGTAFIAGVTIKTYGDFSEDFSGLVVSNHLGYIDIIVHASLFPLRFAPSTDVAAIPLVGWIVKMTDPVFVNRRSYRSAVKAERDFVKTMKKGMSMIVYPESTSTDGKNGILPFKSTAFSAVSNTDIPILPVITGYAESPGKVSPAWHGDMPFLPHLWNILGRSKIEAHVRFLPIILPQNRSRKELAEYAHIKMMQGWSSPAASGN